MSDGGRRASSAPGPVIPAVTAAGTPTERAPGATSTVMPSTIRPASVIPLAGAGRERVPVS